jgi:hypothetical protein
MIQPPTHLCRALRGPGKVDYLVWMVSLGGAICYPLLPFGPPVTTSLLVAIKAAGVGMLALLVFRQAGRRGRSLDTFGLGVALSLSCLGDVFLALRVRNGFVYGLSSFLAAHLIYFCSIFTSLVTPTALAANSTWRDSSATHLQCLLLSLVSAWTGGACAAGDDLCLRYHAHGHSRSLGPSLNKAGSDWSGSVYGI